MYVPVPPAEPESCAVITVFERTLVPMTRELSEMVPTGVGVPSTVSVVPDIVPVNCAEPVATGQ